MTPADIRRLSPTPQFYTKIDDTEIKLLSALLASRMARISQAVAKAAEPFRSFLSKHTSDRERAFFVHTAERLWATDPDTPAVVDHESFYILIPSFCVSELAKAFQIGFLVYLPFIAIDIIVSNILLAMGMMMVSPVTISLPFKLLLFVMVDGWTLLIQGLVRGYMI